MSYNIKLSISSEPYELDSTRVLTAINHIIDDYSMTILDAEGHPEVTSSKAGAVAFGPQVHHEGDGVFEIYGIKSTIDGEPVIEVFMREFASYLNKSHVERYKFVPSLIV